MSKAFIILIYWEQEPRTSLSSLPGFACRTHIWKGIWTFVNASSAYDSAWPGISWVVLLLHLALPGATIFLGIYWAATSNLGHPPGTASPPPPALAAVVEPEFSLGQWLGIKNTRVALVLRTRLWKGTGGRQNQKQARRLCCWNAGCSSFSSGPLSPPPPTLTLRASQWALFSRVAALLTRQPEAPRGVEAGSARTSKVLGLGLAQHHSCIVYSLKQSWANPGSNEEVINDMSWCGQWQKAWNHLHSTTLNKIWVSSQGCCNKFPQTWWLKTADISSIAVLENRIQNKSISRAALPSKALEKDPSVPLPSSKGFQSPLARGCFTPISASTFTWPSSLCLFYLFVFAF